MVSQRDPPLLRETLIALLHRCRDDGYLFVCDGDVWNDVFQAKLRLETTTVETFYVYVYDAVFSPTVLGVVSDYLQWPGEDNHRCLRRRDTSAALSSHASDFRGEVSRHHPVDDETDGRSSRPIMRALAVKIMSNTLLLCPFPCVLSGTGAGGCGAKLLGTSAGKVIAALVARPFGPSRGMDSRDREEVELHPLVNGKTSLDDGEAFESPRQSTELETGGPPTNPRQDLWTKLFVLALACTFGIGSHYSQSCIGPLKDILKRDLNINDSQISLILGSNLVANTIVPIIAGVLVARFGTLKSSLFATSVLFLGQAINLFAIFRGSVYGMIFGLCIFGYRKPGSPKINAV